MFGQLPGEMSYIRGKLADHQGDHIVLFPEGAALVTSPGTEPSYPRPPQSLNDLYEYGCVKDFSITRFRCACSTLARTVVRLTSAAFASARDKSAIHIGMPHLESGLPTLGNHLLLFCGYFLCSAISLLDLP